MSSFLFVDNFPKCKINGIIIHKIVPEQLQYLSQISTGDEVAVNIDPVRRFQLSKSHTATHIMYWQLIIHKKMWFNILLVVISK